jgi:TorA maturation chaperone TorD
MQEMGDLAAFYRAFGLEVALTAHERSDHVSAECEFLLVLCRKEAYAGERDDTAMLETTRRAWRLFLRNHLGRWGPAFGKKLHREDQEGFYGALGLLATDFLSRECAAAGVPAGPEFLRLRSAEPPEVPAGCGPSEDPIQVPPNLVRSRE